jgi:hypothetical protein
VPAIVGIGEMGFQSKQFIGERININSGLWNTGTDSSGCVSGIELTESGTDCITHGKEMVGVHGREQTGEAGLSLREPVQIFWDQSIFTADSKKLWTWWKKLTGDFGRVGSLRL